MGRHKDYNMGQYQPIYAQCLLKVVARCRKTTINNFLQNNADLPLHSMRVLLF